MHRARAGEVRPRIRAVTAFIEVDPNNYSTQISDAQKFLAAAKDALNKAGFEGAGGRITTQPFPQYTKGMKSDDAVAFVGKSRDAASRERSSLRLSDCDLTNILGMRGGEAGFRDPSAGLPLPCSR